MPRSQPDSKTAKQNARNHFLREYGELLQARIEASKQVASLDDGKEYANLYFDETLKLYTLEYGAHGNEDTALCDCVTSHDKNVPALKFGYRDVNNNFHPSGYGVFVHGVLHIEMKGGKRFMLQVDSSHTVELTVTTTAPVSLDKVTSFKSTHDGDPEEDTLTKADLQRLKGDVPIHLASAVQMKRAPGQRKFRY